MSEQTDRAELPPDRLTALWRRLKDHRIAQWTVGYVAVAYGIQHAVTLTTEALDWPHAITRVSMILLALGLPLAMVFAWYHGERTTRRISPGEMSVVSVMLIGISLIFYLFVRPANETVPAAQLTSAAAPAAANGISLAVLPFVNLSPDRDQEFFSDGMTEEITAALAKIPNLRVVARTSAFEFKGKNLDVRTVGGQLGATHLIEGSVRRDGNQVRITAQLVKAGDGTHLWTESYDRELKGIFAVQEDIAQAIAASLRVPLGLKQGETLVSNRTGDTESYQNYLRAKALYRARAAKPLSEPVALLEKVAARDPDYAPAWALLAQAYALAPIYDPASYVGSVTELRRIADTSLAKAETSAQRAIQLDARNADSYTALAVIQGSRGKFLAAEDLFKQALALDPLNPDTLHQYSALIAITGHPRQAVAMREQLRGLEPLVPIFNLGTARVLWASGQSDAAIALASAVSFDNPNRWTSLAMFYTSQGRYRQAADAVRAIPSGTVITPAAAEAAIRLLRAGPSKSASQQTLTDLGALSFVYLYAGAPERALQWVERGVEANYQNAFFSYEIWQASYASARKTERFKKFARVGGLVEYWRAKGWPPQCRPTTGDDFECS